MTRKFAPTWRYHIERYAFALPYCYKKNVVDAGCQTGFGANIVSHVATSMVLLDNNQQNLELAAKLYKPHCETEYLYCDLETNYPEFKGSMDTVIAFELIEHLENPEFFIENVAKNLPVGGRLVFSVPHMVANKEHKHLYDGEKIYDLVSRFLVVEEFYVQEHGAIDSKPLYKGLVCHVGVGVKK